MDEEDKQFSNSKISALGCCVAFVWFFVNFSLVLLIKVLFIKKRVKTEGYLVHKRASIDNFFYGHLIYDSFFVNIVNDLLF